MPLLMAVSAVPFCRILDIGCFVDPFELLTAETELEWTRLEVGVTRRHSLHDPHAIAPVSVGAQCGHRQQLLLGVGNQPEIAFVTQGTKKFLGELAEDQEPLSIVSLGLVIGNQPAPTRPGFFQPAVGWISASLLFRAPACTKLLDVALEDGLEVMLRIELIDVRNSRQFDRHGSAPENRH